MRVHVLFTVLLFALRTAYRLPCEQANREKEPVGWQRWRRQLLEESRDHLIVFAQDGYGIFHMAEYSQLFGVKLKDVPPGIGTCQAILARYGLAAHGCPSNRISVKANKSDMRNAEAMAEGVTRPTMRFVLFKLAAQ